MENLFGFDYEVNNIVNRDGTPSPFFSVYGDQGKVMHCKKDSYNLVATEDVSKIAQAFIDNGHNVEPFVHRNGEKIGFKVTMGNRPSRLGEKRYAVVVTIPNNGGGRGYFSVEEERLICTNGMTSKIKNKDNSVRIPHNSDYKEYLKLMQKAIEQFTILVQDIEANDLSLNEKTLDKHEAMFQLNKWYYEQEMPSSHRDDMTFDEFRKLLATAPTEIKSYKRYMQLMEAFNKELGYNTQLDLKLSMYTVFAACTNYISRRIEASASKAPTVIQFERQSEKLAQFIA